MFSRFCPGFASERAPLLVYAGVDGLAVPDPLRVLRRLLRAPACRSLFAGVRRRVAVALRPSTAASRAGEGRLPRARVLQPRACCSGRRWEHGLCGPGRRCVRMHGVGQIYGMQSYADACAPARTMRRYGGARSKALRDASRRRFARRWLKQSGLTPWNSFTGTIFFSLPIAAHRYLWYADSERASESERASARDTM